MSKLKLVMLASIVEATESVRVAWMTSPGASVLPPPSHDSSRAEGACEGVHPVAERLNVASVLPMFLIQSVWVVFSPGCKAPQFTETVSAVHALF